MRLRHIEVFNAVFALGSVSGAARFLNITQPTASKILRNAEDQIGFELFRRVRGRLIPTEEAAVLYRETKAISDRVVSLQKIAGRLLEADRGHIRLSAVLALGLEHIPRAIARFRRKHPDVRFEFQTRHYDNLLSDILEQDKDLGIAFNPPAIRGLDYIELGAGEFVCIYSGSEFDDFPERIRMADIVDRQFVGIENSGPLADLLNKMLAEAGVDLYSSVTAQTYFVARNLVAMGCGVAIVDEFTATSSGVGSVKYKKLSPPLRFSVKAIHKDTRPPSKLISNFVQFLKKDMFQKR